MVQPATWVAAAINGLIRLSESHRIL